MQAVVDVVEDGDLSIISRPPTLQVLRGTMVRSFYGRVAGVGHLVVEG
jgi:hypothetical protein